MNEVAYLDRIERFTGKTLPQSVIPGLEPTRPLRRAGGGAPRASKGRPGAPGKKPFTASKGRVGAPASGARREQQVVVEYRRGRGGAAK